MVMGRLLWDLLAIRLRRSFRPPCPWTSLMIEGGLRSTGCMERNVSRKIEDQ